MALGRAERHRVYLRLTAAALAVHLPVPAFFASLRTADAPKNSRPPGGAGRFVAAPFRSSFLRSALSSSLLFVSSIFFSPLPPFFVCFPFQIRVGERVRPLFDSAARQ